MSEPLVGILMGSESDRTVMEKATAELDARGIPSEINFNSDYPRVLPTYRSLPITPEISGRMQTIGQLSLIILTVGKIIRGRRKKPARFSQCQIHLSPDRLFFVELTPPCQHNCKKKQAKP